MKKENAMTRAGSILPSVAAVVAALFAACASAEDLPQRPTVMEPSWILKSESAYLWLDAWDYSSFTTNAEGGVTAWADKSGSGNDATAYQVGDAQVYGTVGVTNGVPAYLMGPIASCIDLKFTLCSSVRTVFWVMDIAGKGKDIYHQAFFLGAPGYDYNFHRAYDGGIAHASDAHAGFRDSVFRIDGDGSYTGKLPTTIPPKGTHIYTSVATSNLKAAQLSRDRSSTTRNGGRALSELIILTRPLDSREVESVETYLNAKWFDASETVSARVEAKMAYPSLTLEGDAALVIPPHSYSYGVDTPCIAVYGTLANGASGKVRIESGIYNVPYSRIILKCGAVSGISSLDDFELVGFPAEARFEWDGTELTMICDHARSFAPALLHADPSHRALVWLDATDAGTFVTNAEGGVTTWIDKSGSGNNAVSYKLGDTQQYGVRGVTNGCMAFLMGPCGSDIDLKFNATDYDLYGAYWVMDIVRDTPYSGSPWPTAFFLGGYSAYDFHRGVQGGANSRISDLPPNKGGSGCPEFISSDFRIDGVYYDPSQTKPALGTHIYSAQMTNGACQASRISGDRGIAKRNGGRALSELILFGFELTEAEKDQMDDYLNVKWYGASETLASEVDATEPVSFPNLVLDDGASFRVYSTTLGFVPCVSVFGALTKGTAGKVLVEFVGTPVGTGSRTIFECADIYGYDKESDFVVAGLPDGVEVYWEGNALKVAMQPPSIAPAVLTTSGTTAPWLWLDAADSASFTTNSDGGVTAWADRGARGHDATAYKIGDNQVYGTIGITNGVPAYFMGPHSSRIDLKFEPCQNIRTVFWVMDLAQNAGLEADYQPFLLGADASLVPYSSSYHFHRGYHGWLLSTDASANIRNGDFAIDGDHSCSGNLTATYPPKGTHLYAAATLGDCAACRLSGDRDKVGRNGGRALSELVILTNVLTEAEYASVENYLNAKWFMKSVTVAEPVAVASPVTYPFLLLDDGASFAVSRSALSRTETAITVFGSLRLGTAEKIRIAYSGDESLPGRPHALLSCSDAGGVQLDDFDLVGFPEGASFEWDGKTLTVADPHGMLIFVR